MSNDWERGRLFLKVAISLNPEPPDWYWLPFVSWHYWHEDYEAALDYAMRIHGKTFYWSFASKAMAYVGVGAFDEAKECINGLLELRPDFAKNAREELGRWLDEERIEAAIGVLKKAGLKMRHTS